MTCIAQSEWTMEYTCLDMKRLLNGCWEMNRFTLGVDNRISFELMPF